MGASESTPESQPSPSPDQPTSATQSQPSGCPVQHSKPVGEWRSECPASGAGVRGGCPVNKDGLDPRNMVCIFSRDQIKQRLFFQNLYYNNAHHTLTS